MFPRPTISRVPLFCTLFLAALCALASPKTKEPAPRFNAKTLEGEKFTNDSIKGKVVLLEFWTTWCVYCFEEAGLVDQLNREFRDKGLIVLAAMYEATVYPIYVVIDRDGNITGTQRGAEGEEALRDLLASGGMGSKEEADSR
jgi:thiol-disulfide isomerase/thioredoxin